MTVRKHIAVLLCLAGAIPAGATTIQDVRNAFDQKQWDATAQMAHEILTSRPRDTEAALRGAYALFEKGYANAALLLLRSLTSEQWRQIPAELKQFAEVVSLLQKKVPLTVLSSHADQVNENEVPASLRDEVLYAKGRAAYERGDFPAARNYLNQVTNGSRYHAEAHYLLTVIEVREGNYETAKQEISRMFENTFFEQSSEFWNDVTTDISRNFGASVKVFFNTDFLEKANVMGHLGTMALARVHYARKQFDLALAKYQEIPQGSRFYSRSRLERLWALLQANRHEDAQEEARALSTDQHSFEAVEARIVRGVVLTDARQIEKAREQLLEFQKYYGELKRAMEKYTQYGITKALPAFTRTELARDERLRDIETYQKIVEQEIAALQRNSVRLFPVYQAMARELRGLITEARALEARIKKEYIRRRTADLDDLYVQARLIMAETYLEEREQLRQKFQSPGGKVTPEMQLEHDRALVAILERVVNEVAGVFPMIRKRNPYLEFRHSEILWELGTARLILAQSEDREKNIARGEKARLESLAYAEKVVREFPEFPKRAQAMFFVGFAQLEMDKPEQGYAALKEYAKTYPLHEHIPDAYRILGDYAFDMNRFQEALGYFLKILEFPDSPVGGYAFYKIAWCYYNLHQYAKAMLGMEKAISWANRAAEEGQLLSLKREARRDLISLYSEFGDARKALEYYESFIGGRAYDWLEELAARYDEAGQWDKASYIYNVLISLDASPDKNIGHYAKVIEGLYRLQEWNRVFEAAKDLTASYAERLKVPAAKETPAFAAEDALRRVAMAQHFEFGEDPKATESIIALDRVYMDTFFGWPTAQPLFYKHAFFLNSRKKQTESAAVFKRHWELFKDQLKEPLREESLRNLVNSMAALDNENKIEENKDRPATKPIPMPDFAEDLVAYSLVYMQEYPKSKERRGIEFARATTLLKYQRIGDGIEATQKVFDENGTDEIGKKAFQNLRVAYYNQKDWQAAYEWSSRMLSRNSAAVVAYEKDLRTVRSETLFLWANETTDNAKSAELFLKLVKESNNDRLKDKSLYNAIVRFHQQDDRVKVLQLSQELEKIAPKSEFIPKLNGIRAALYQDAGDYVAAYPLLLKFIKNPEKDTSPELLHQAILNAGLMAQGLGRDKDAVAFYHEYIAKAAGADSPQVKQAQSGITYIKAKNEREVAAVYAPWAGLQREKEVFIQKPVPAKGALAARIKGGAQALQQLVNRFLKISSDPAVPNFHAFEAFCAVPMFYRGFAMGVLDLERAVPEAAREEVRKELQKVAQPMIEKSTDLAGECLAKARDARHDGPWFREVNRSWGWESDPQLADNVTALIRKLEEGRPWVAPAPLEDPEAGLIRKHLEKQESPDSWYSLSVRRLQENRISLARLTLIDALSRLRKAQAEGKAGKNDDDDDDAAAAPSKAGRILNMLAHIEWITSNPKGIVTVFEKAAEEGAAYAHVNLALIHLKGGRLEQARQWLHNASQRGVFASHPEIHQLVTRVLPPEGAADGAEEGEK